jgi:hypothetical protein
MQTSERAGERTQRNPNGVIADIILGFTSMEASAPDNSNAARSPFDLLRALYDAKTLACGDACTSFSAAHPNDRETPPVEKRAAKMPEHHLAATRDLGQKFHNS